MLWYNLMLSGEGDFRTRHAGCPVLVGTKWGEYFLCLHFNYIPSRFVICLIDGRGYTLHRFCRPAILFAGTTSALSATRRGPDPNRPTRLGPNPNRPTKRSHDPIRPTRQGLNPNRPTKRGPDPNRPTRRAIFF